MRTGWPYGWFWKFLERRFRLKVKWTKKLKYFLLSLYLHQTLKRTILSEIWVKIFLPKPLKKDKRSKSDWFPKTSRKRFLNGRVIDWKLRDVNVGFSGRKNVLPKLLRILIAYVCLSRSVREYWLRLNEIHELREFAPCKGFFLFLSCFFVTSNLLWIRINQC